MEGRQEKGRKVEKEEGKREGRQARRERGRGRERREYETEEGNI